MNPMRGILCKVFALFLFAIMDALIKASVEHVPAWEAVFFRSFFAMIVIVVWLIYRGEIKTGLKVVSPMGHFWRGLIGTSGMALGFVGLALLPLPQVVAIRFAAPLMIVIFAAMLLGEQIRLVRLSAVTIGLVGVGVVLYPSLVAYDNGGPQTVMLLGAIVVLGAAVCQALAQIHIRRLAQTEQTSAIVFYFSLTATLLSALTFPFGWVVPTAKELVFLISAGFIGGVAQIFITTSLKHAEASLLAPFNYVSMIFAVLIGYFIFAEIPTLWTISGACLIISGGILIIWREHKLGLLRRRSPENISPQE